MVLTSFTGLSENRKNLQDEVFMANPVLPEDVLTEAIPGNIRKATHFVAFLKRFIEYIKVIIATSILL
jgi:DNA excision repair protein ERCC-2